MPLLLSWDNGQKLSDNTAVPEETLLEALGQETLSMESV